MLERILNLYYTLKDLKWIQIRYQIAYRFNKRKFKTINYNGDISQLQFNYHFKVAQSLSSDLRFSFLNQEYCFEHEIDWDYSELGKLWTYNLNYFDFLNQEGLDKEIGDSLIQSFISDPPLTLDPYPTSLRLINWIKFVSKHCLNDERISDSLFSQAAHLTKTLEYHLMGNHLLENGFALLFAGFYFNNGQFYNKAEDIISSQLKEQILEDGGHFELSPMYHCLIFHRVLESIDLLRNNTIDFPYQNLLGSLEENAMRMLSWLNKMTYKDGTFPMFNDSTVNIAPTPESLFLYAEKLKIRSAEKNLSDSGYRKVENANYELFFDVGQIGPAYIPGHAHSDTLSILMHVGGKPFLVDRGITTYEKNQTRQLERSTSSHNTLKINEKEQSAVWSGFRVGRKARIIDLVEKEKAISATHNGYSFMGVLHKRRIEYSEKSILIVDSVSKNNRCVAAFHFHPDIMVTQEEMGIKAGECILSFEHSEKIEIQEYAYSGGFNQARKANKVNVFFKLKLTTKIIIE